MEVGDTIYFFDANHREYERDSSGHAHGGPIWIKHWRKLKIVGETKVSWLVGWASRPDKINKKKLAMGELSHYCTSWEHIQELAWVHDHRYKIVRLLERENSPYKIRKIAEILDYSEEPHK